MAVRVADAKKPVAADATNTVRRGTAVAAKRAAVLDTWAAAARTILRKDAANLMWMIEKQSCKAGRGGALLAARGGAIRCVLKQR